MALTWRQALGWRLQRQLLDPVGHGSAADVVARLGAVPAWPDLAAELAIGSRRRGGRSGDAARALAAGEVVCVYAFRGATHLMTPGDAGAYLALRASSRMWELPSWRSFYGLEPAEWPRFREYVRSALTDGPLTRSELATAFGRSRRYRHLQALVLAGNDTLLKPLSWQGDIGLGPARDGHVTFQRLDQVPGWSGLSDLDVAGPTVIEHFIGVYGPTTEERVQDWFGQGLGAKAPAVRRWLEQVKEQCEPVTVEGDRAVVLRADVDDLQRARTSTAVRLLPGRDPWVMAPGTTDVRVVPPARREAVSRSANLVVWRGSVAGTWAQRQDRLVVSWFAESGRVPRTALDEEATRLSAFLDRPLELTLASTDDR